jgi:hypothetical protein
MRRDEAFVIVAALVLNGLLGLSIYLEPFEPPDPPDTWEELFETGEQFRESSYSTFIGVLSSADRPVAVQGGNVIYRRFLTLEIDYRVNATVFLVDKTGFHISLESTQADEPMEGFSIGERVKVRGYPDYGPDIDGRMYKTLIVDVIERVDEGAPIRGS